MAELPIIDLSKSKTHRSDLGKEIVHALENVGFLFLENVDGLDFDMLYKSCKWFFKLPMNTKKKLMRNFWNPESKNIYRGYFPVVDGEPSHKEGFECARDVPPGDTSVSPKNWFYEKSVWPDEDGSFPFKKFVQATYEVFHNTAMEILKLTAIGLGIEEDAFTGIFQDKPMSTFRLMHYPSWDGKPPDNAIIEDGRVVTTPDHMDSNFLTLLSIFDYEGLEVKNTNDEWIAVHPRPKTLIMNIGVTLSRMMGGRFKATRHRVMDIGIDRYSVPFFLSPSYNSDVGINFMSKYEKGGPEHVPERYGPWVLHRIKHEVKYFEYRVLPEIES
jgi:isopenicillin N synthase-like dioxygenase